ncbi:Re/Si-specific NAD(P)(+) transhydrogenase subunit alpha [Fluoribacter dumoffii]|uniref:NAD(P) transhydrogenase subunit alpha part 1 n=1 Tax=Fluoribacter dumoffii TaxID=463 RepID=A0A377GDA2_9GAMM|nr:Re/Si-specific NAD(P)(+) transhydrogenase subunit alpha [Fluoribacter dumoffii]KTC90598.1 pyridine nucleotide transhydrogenase, alpha subunit [Fluoribacter dumoffii NY 23]MCW8386277.1 Re/Si-specific NAD(P)(+) transhydrogenase subunit alpha [Fluoribacter dumoffii]MCW8419330.1 Re/Si-specific NAD(P)(+) transhydrogenase subunit alpha [Fluoribacter dumoffii]MCW8452795.1 Re/Si-specific NAD(P)(+) transhydrogenase subunit alpha [Fluoribacter dumoffii]MCW8459955.1 Re/Si-specific NAD(P)(+) transhydro
MMIATLLAPDNETRVAITPNSAKHFIKSGFEVAIEKNAGLAAGFKDKDYEQVGVSIQNKKNLLEKANVLLCINEPAPKELDGLSEGALVIGHIDNNPESKLITWCQEKQLTLFSMNLIPRISRAQSMDSLSSQANLAGYRAVLEACSQFHRAIPMMMTAAGMIQPAKVLILGAGVAGLQAIATAKRLGAVVYAFDVRRAAKEQVESLGAEFIEVSQNEDSETKGGYASEMSEEYKKLQAELIDQYAKLADIVISTALIPGKKAPVLLYKKTVEQMKPGSVIVDLATSRGGNCEVSAPDKTIKHGEITVIGFSNMAGLVPTTASELYANNLVHLIDALAPTPPEITLNPNDEIIQQAVLCHQNQYLPFQVKETQNA